MTSKKFDRCRKHTLKAWLRGCGFLYNFQYCCIEISTENENKIQGVAKQNQNIKALSINNFHIVYGYRFRCIGSMNYLKA